MRAFVIRYTNGVVASVICCTAAITATTAAAAAFAAIGPAVAATITAIVTVADASKTRGAVGGVCVLDLTLSDAVFVLALADTAGLPEPARTCSHRVTAAI